MRHKITLIVFLALIVLSMQSCVRVPKHVDVGGVVEQRVSISASLQLSFQKNCTDLAVDAGLIPGSVLFNAYVEQCTIDLTQQFIRLLGGL